MFAIAAGVAAIVGLQSLALSVDDTVTNDILTTHQADIVVSVEDRGRGRQANVGSGISESPAFASDVFTGEERSAFQELAATDGWIDSTYVYVANPDRPSFIAAAGGAGSGGQFFLQPYLIEPGKYPLYGGIRAVKPKGAPLGELLTSPGEIALSRSIANRVGVDVGDSVTLENSRTFLVKGIVSNEAAGSPLFAPIFVPPLPWFAYAALDDPIARETFNLDEGDANVLFIKTRTPADAAALAGVERSGGPAGESIRGISSTFDVETAEEALPEIEDATDILGKFLLIAGLVSLVIGGIGILNTMLVVVGRRTMEVGILKSLGLKGRQITTLFVIEAVLMGLVGSIAGILLGILLSFALTGFGEQFLQSNIDWSLQTEPIINGLIVGVVVTVVFGFLPVLAAGRVRPNVVLQAQASTLPRSGRVVSLVVVLALAAVIGVVASVFVGNWTIGMIGTYGAMAVLALLSLALLLVVWLVGKLPTFGSITLKLSLRGLSRQRGRAASTLLALVVGLFAMSTIVILGDSMKQFVDETLESELGGNLLVILPDPDLEIRDQARDEIDRLGQAERVVETHEFENATLVAINGAALGQPGGEQGAPQPPGPGSLQFASTMVAQSGASADDAPEMLEGRYLVPEDAGRAVVVVGSDPPWLQTPIIGHARVGDDLTFLVSGQEVTLALVGMMARDHLQVGFSDGRFFVPLGAIPDNLPRSSIGFQVTVPEGESAAAAAQLNRNVPGVVTVEVDAIASLFKEILDRITVLPSVLSALALFTGAVIIANSVALATLERRREIALMKTVGAKANKVLTMLLIENGILGIIGGAIGVLLAIVVLVIFNQAQPDVPVSPNPLSILFVLAVALGVALGAALLSAWPASREKPLEVLRYE
ncbi:MAG: FtsX-like permease family protein [Chloroflexi bacterium]|nr:FtsX-like permease family protein [Chloroflexota bacterium]